MIDIKKKLEQIFAFTAPEGQEAKVFSLCIAIRDESYGALDALRKAKDMAEKQEATNKANYLDEINRLSNVAIAWQKKAENTSVRLEEYNKEIERLSKCYTPDGRLVSPGVNHTALLGEALGALRVCRDSLHYLKGQCHDGQLDALCKRLEGELSK